MKRSGVTAVTGDSSGEIDVSWMGDAAATGFKIRVMRAGGAVQVVDAGNVTEYTLTGLIQGQTYCIWVVAYNANGDGPYPAQMQANAMAFLPEIPVAVGAVQGFVARQGFTVRTIECAWLPLSGATGYRLTFWRGTELTQFQFDLSASLASYVFVSSGAFAPGTSFNLQIEAQIDSTYGPPLLISDVSSGNVAADLPIPSGLSVTLITEEGARIHINSVGVNPDHIDFRWSTDPTFGTYDSVRQSFTSINYIFTGLDGNTTYYVEVYTVETDADPDAFSEPASTSFTTLETPTSVPPQVTGVNGIDIHFEPLVPEIRIQWNVRSNGKRIPYRNDATEHKRNGHNRCRQFNTERR